MLDANNLIQLRVIHVPGHLNTVADALSCGALHTVVDSIPDIVIDMFSSPLIQRELGEAALWLILVLSPSRNVVLLGLGSVCFTSAPSYLGRRLMFPLGRITAQLSTCTYHLTVSTTFPLNPLQIQSVSSPSLCAITLNQISRHLSFWDMPTTRAVLPFSQGHPQIYAM